MKAASASTWLEAIARTVDPGYDQTCRLVEREFTQAELAEIGIGWPTAPDGYSLLESHTSGTEQIGPCSQDIREGYYNASWTFEGEGDERLYASAWLNQFEGDGDSEGFIGENYMNWRSDDGVYYSVESWSRSSDDGDREAMIALAESLDPGLDVESLDDEPIIRPLEDAASDSGAAPAPEAGGIERNSRFLLAAEGGASQRRFRLSSARASTGTWEATRSAIRSGESPRICVCHGSNVCSPRSGAAFDGSQGVAERWNPDPFVGPPAGLGVVQVDGSSRAPSGGGRPEHRTRPARDRRESPRPGGPQGLAALPALTPMQQSCFPAHPRASSGHRVTQTECRSLPRRGCPARPPHCSLLVQAIAIQRSGSSAVSRTWKAPCGA